MKKINLYAFILTLLGIISCTEKTEENVFPEWFGEGDIAVKFSLPSEGTKAEVQAKPVTIYAFDKTVLASGSVEPIAPFNIQGGTYFYNVPKGKSIKDLFFTSISGLEDSHFKLGMDKEQTFNFSIPENSETFQEEILCGVIDQAAEQGGSLHRASVKRLSSELRINLDLLDRDGKPSIQEGMMIPAVSVTLKNLSNNISYTQDGKIIKGKADRIISQNLFSYDKSHYESDPFTILPGKDKIEITLNIGLAHSDTIHITRVLPDTLNVNRRYDLNLKLTTYDQSFILSEPYFSHRESYYDNSAHEVDYFEMIGSRMIGSKKGDKTKFELKNNSLYPIEVQIVSGSEFFQFTTEGNALVVTALQDNVADFRKAETRIICNGVVKKVSFYQALQKKQRLVIKAITGNSRVLLTGENIIREDRKETDSPETKIDEYLNPGEYVYTADHISDVSFNSVEFNAIECPYIEKLSISGTGQHLDLSDFINVNEVLIEQSRFETIDYGDASKIEKLSIKYCNDVTAMNLFQVVNTLEELYIYDCDNFTNLLIYNPQLNQEKKLRIVEMDSNHKLHVSDFSNLPHLTYAKLADISPSNDVDFSNCPLLKELYISDSAMSDAPTINLNIENCTSLETLSLYSYNFLTLLRTGNEPLKKIHLNGSFDRLDLSGLQSLEEFKGKNNYSPRLSVRDFKLLNCPNIKVCSDLWFNHVGTIEIAGLKNCLSEVHIEMEKATDQHIHIHDCNALSHLTMENMSKEMAKLENLPKLEWLELSLFREINHLNIKNLENLKQLSLHEYDHWDYPDSLSLHSFDLPVKLNKLELAYLSADNLDLDFSGLTELEDFETSNANISSLNFNGCVKLKYVNKETNFYNNCLNSINLGGCSSLEYLNLPSTQLKKLDIRPCKSLRYIQVENGQLDNAALVDIFSNVPDRTTQTIPGQYKIIGNPGAESFDASIAEKKGWLKIQ